MVDALMTTLNDLFSSVFEKSDFDTWLEDVGACDDCFIEYLGSDHAAIVIEAGKTLFVDFSSFDDLFKTEKMGQPLAWGIAQEFGWSTLSLVSSKDTWFRDPYVYAYFNRLVDDGILDDYDRVIFYGSEQAGYAAAAYSVCYPNAEVILISPQATQDPDIAIWDRRHPQARRLNFRAPYGYAPTMAEAAARITVLYDPLLDEDAMHAALFPQKTTRHIRVRHHKSDIERMLIETGLFNAMIETVVNNATSTQPLFELLRERHMYLPYLRSLLVKCDQEKRYTLAKAVCTHTLKHYNAPRFRKYLTVIENMEAEQKSAGKDNSVA